MVKHGDCMCRVCEQKRLAAAEVDKLKSMMVKPLSADHEMQRALEVDERRAKRWEKTQEDVERIKVAAADKRIADLQAKILKQDKQFLELVQENEKIKFAISENCQLRKHINSLESQIRNQFNSLADVTMTAFNRSAEIGDLENKLEFAQNEAEYWRLRAKANAEQINDQKPFYNGGCV